MNKISSLISQIECSHPISTSEYNAIINKVDALIKDLPPFFLPVQALQKIVHCFSAQELSDDRFTTLRERWSLARLELLTLEEIQSFQELSSEQLAAHFNQNAIQTSQNHSFKWIRQCGAHIIHLDLEHTIGSSAMRNLNDNSLHEAVLSVCPNIQSLCLGQAHQITDETLTNLGECNKNLKFLYISFCYDLSFEAVERLGSELPDLTIELEECEFKEAI